MGGGGALQVEADGAGVVETYTVVHGREGPERGIVIGRLEDGRRFLANTPDDRALLEAFVAREELGRRIGRFFQVLASSLRLPGGEAINFGGQSIADDGPAFEQAAATLERITRGKDRPSQGAGVPAPVRLSRAQGRPEAR